jgi:hypothetical protein
VTAPGESTTDHVHIAVIVTHDKRNHVGLGGIERLGVLTLRFVDVLQPKAKSLLNFSVWEVLIPEGNDGADVLVSVDVLVAGKGLEDALTVSWRVGASSNG